MRPSIVLGIATLALGLGFSKLAQDLIAITASNSQQAFSQIFAVVLFVFFASTLIGIGAANLVHWILGFGKKSIIFWIEIILSIGVLFAGIGGAIVALTQSSWILALHIFLSSFVASWTMLSLSFVTGFGAIVTSLAKLKWQAKKNWPWKKKKRKKR